MKKLLYILLFLFIGFKSFSTLISPKDTTKPKFNFYFTSLSDQIRKKKLLYHFDGNFVHLIFDSHYVDTVRINVYDVATLKNLSATTHLIKKQEDNIEFQINTHQRPILIFVECGVDFYIYETE